MLTAVVGVAGKTAAGFVNFNALGALGIAAVNFFNFEVFGAKPLAVYVVLPCILGGVINVCVAVYVVLNKPGIPVKLATTSAFAVLDVVE
jgi:hypothetical protein